MTTRKVAVLNASPADTRDVRTTYLTMDGLAYESSDAKVVEFHLQQSEQEALKQVHGSIYVIELLICFTCILSKH